MSEKAENFANVWISDNCLRTVRSVTSVKFTTFVQASFPQALLNSHLAAFPWMVEAKSLAFYPLSCLRLNSSERRTPMATGITASFFTVSEITAKVFVPIGGTTLRTSSNSSCSQRWMNCLGLSPSLMPVPVTYRSHCRMHVIHPSSSIPWAIFGL